jgi:uncharacterized coiled-coil protein SlyX
VEAQGHHNTIRTVLADSEILEFGVTPAVDEAIRKVAEHYESRDARITERVRAIAEEIPVPGPQVAEFLRDTGLESVYQQEQWPGGNPPPNPDPQAQVPHSDPNEYERGERGAAGVRSVSHRLDAIERTVTAVQSATESIEGRVTQLERTLEQGRERLSSLEGNVEALQAAARRAGASV